MRPQTSDERHFAQALACLQAGDLRSAEKLCRGLMKHHPHDASLCGMLGVVLMKRGQHRDAVEQFRKALAGGPPEAGLYNNLALALNGAGRQEEAIEAARTAVRLRPEVAEFQAGLGNHLKKAGLVEQAKTAYRQAISLNPNLTSAYVALGGLCAAVGDKDSAVQLYRKALEVRPGYALAFYHLALSSKTGESVVDQATIDAFQDLLEADNLNRSDSLLVHNALGFIADQRGEHDSAFGHFEAFNERAKTKHRARGQAYDRVAHTRMIDRIIEACPLEAFEVRGEPGSTSRRPLFIVGMPRSGTTLVEQILGGHGLVVPGGELAELDRIAETEPDYPVGVHRLSGQKLRVLAERYLGVLDRIDATAERVSDKTLRNFLHLGWIARLFPTATIVDCRRNPIDTCLSCYFHNFAATKDFSNDLTDIGAYYLDYVRLMTHWNRVLPLKVVQVDYEELVADPEPVVRCLLDAIDLAWDPDCLNFAQNPRPILTASLWQVRQPITTKAVGRWRRYEKHLEPLKRALAGVESIP